MNSYAAVLSSAFDFSNHRCFNTNVDDLVKALVERLYTHVMENLAATIIQHLVVGFNFATKEIPSILRLTFATMMDLQRCWT